MQIISARLIKKTFCDYDCALCGEKIPEGSNAVRVLTNDPKPFQFVCMGCANEELWMFLEEAKQD